MVAVQISGGLGNQILQYAMARGIAAMRNDEPVLDTSYYFRRKCQKHEELLLNDYPLKYNRVLTERELFSKFRWLYPRGKLYYLKILNNAIQFRRVRKQIFANPNILSNNNMDYVNNTCNVEGDIFIIGYPFHLKYFEDIADELRREFIPKHIEPSVAEQIVQMDKHSVSVHVRVTDSQKTALPQYYANASAWMSKRISEPVFYIFSNDIEKARKCIDFPGNVIYTETTTAVQDLYLMSNCHHHILAESTFSWCGAWLSGKENQCVVYPTGWGRMEGPKTTIPDEWVPIEGMSYEK